MKTILLAGTALTVLAVSTIGATAGGLALREQSAFGQGSSFAGVAAGGSLSSMFWNPATMTQTYGITAEAVASIILPNVSHVPNTGNGIGVGNSGVNAFIPAGYGSYQLTRDMFLGLSVNVPYGLSVAYPSAWAGRNYALDSSLKTQTATPSVAYRINDWLSVGAGFQIQFAQADLGRGLPLVPGASSNLNGSGFGYGFTAGVTLSPTPNTTIGIGYRSIINQEIKGTLTAPAAFAPTSGSVKTSLALPDMISVGLRHRLDPQWTVMGTFEYTRWSRIGTSQILQPNGAAATIGGAPAVVALEFRDGYFYSVGAEYQWTPQYAFRAGIGFERSPVSDQVRNPLLPDNDRIWLSLGASNNLTRNLRLDLAYSHVMVKNAPINEVAGNPSFSAAAGVYTGNVQSSIDIISVGLKYSFDDPPAPRRLITK